MYIVLLGRSCYSTSNEHYSADSLNLLVPPQTKLLFPSCKEEHYPSIVSVHTAVASAYSTWTRKIPSMQHTNQEHDLP